MSNIQAGKKVHLVLEAVDAQGNVVPVTFENVVWVNSNEAAVATVNSGDLFRDVQGVTAGQSSTVSVSCTIAGQSFSALIDEQVTAAPPAAIRITETPID